MVGEHQAIMLIQLLGEQSFPTANLNVLWRHGASPCLLVTVGPALRAEPWAGPGNY
jgi:hypothetical protein